VAALEAHPICRISAVSVLEAHIVVRAREHPTMLGKLQRFLEEIDAVVMPFDEHQARLADAAFQRYGKGQRATLLSSTWAIAWLTPWPRRWGSRYCSLAMISAIRTSPDVDPRRLCRGDCRSRSPRTLGESGDTRHYARI
jgi:hypothetical protein